MKRSFSIFQHIGKRVVVLLLGALLSLLLVVHIVNESYSLVDNPLKFKPVGLPTEVVREPRGTVRRSHDGGSALRKSLWSEPNTMYHQCIRQSEDEKRTVESTDGYLMFHANGGLNQMRTAICDMVAVARILNATLVVPDLDHDSYWNDSSKFEDIFDVQHFIHYLQYDVRIVRTLPDMYNSSKAHKLSPNSWADIDYYKTEILPRLWKHKVLYFTLTDSRLASNGVPNEMQRLRCRTNYEALQFTEPIRLLAGKIIRRLRGQGPYIALHLRYERDMLAFTGCTHELTDVEAEELKQLRYSNSRWKEKAINATSKRAAGGCPLTPYETQLFLKAMGYPANTTVYIAGGPIYGGEQRLRGFTSYYKNAVNKDTVASKSELKELSKYQNRLAALDYMVAVQSDVFVPSFDGNMARTVEGHRRFEGHRKTLLPDRAQLVKIFDDYAKGTSWSTVEVEVQRAHRDRQGQPHCRVPLSPSQAKVEENFYANPLPGCICRVGCNRTS